MSGCRHHRNDPQCTEVCGGCYAEGEVLLEAFRNVGFRGKLDTAAHHKHNVQSAVALLRRYSYWGAADLLEAAASAWNQLNWPRVAVSGSRRVCVRCGAEYSIGVSVTLCAPDGLPTSTHDWTEA